MRVKDAKKYEAISNAAITLICQEGLSGTSMSKIAKAANVSPATIYVYFENKEAMIGELYRTCKKQMSVALLQEFKPNGDFVIEFRKLWNNLLDYALQGTKEFAFLQQFENSPHLTQAYQNHAKEYFTPIFIFFEKAKRDKKIKNVPFELIYAFCFIPAIRLASQHLSHAFNLNDTTKEQAIALALDTICLSS